MRVYIKDVEGLKIPEKAHPTDTGFDIYATSHPIIEGEIFDYLGKYRSINYIWYKTNIFLNLGADEKVYVNLRPRSSNRKKNLILANSIGLCDNGYTGEYVVSFVYQIQPKDLKIIGDIITTSIDYDKLYKKGDAIGQLEFLRGNMDVDFILTSEKEFAELEANSIRKAKGHGSTDDKISRR